MFTTSTPSCLLYNLYTCKPGQTDHKPACAEIKGLRVLDY